MRTPLVRALVVTLLAFLAGCADASVGPRLPGLPFAQAMPSCGPSDGPAVSVFLSATPQGPEVHVATGTVLIAIYQPLDRVVGRGWTLGGESDASVIRWLSLEAIDGAVSGSVVITAVRADRTVEGFLDVRFPDGAGVRQSFRAPWFPAVTLCG